MLAAGGGDPPTLAPAEEGGAGLQGADAPGAAVIGGVEGGMAQNQNLHAVLAQMISALQATTNATSSSGAGSVAPAAAAAAAATAGSLGVASGGSTSDVASAVLSPANVILLPAGALQLQLAGQGLGNLPYLLNLPGASLNGLQYGQYALPLAHLQQLGAVDLTQVQGLLPSTSNPNVLPAAPAAGEDAGAGAPQQQSSADADAAARKASAAAGSGKRPGDSSPAGALAPKRERADDGRPRDGRRENTQSIPNLPHLKGKCHVDGCATDLATLSNYYKRYRTCEVHLKCMSVIKDGVQQRFCQQCGRFHLLQEFDGNKRSCRDRLESHNVRRRKRSEEAALAQAAAAAAGGFAVPATGSGGGGGGAMAQPLDLQLPSASAVQAAGAPAPGGGSTSFAELLQQQQQQVVMTSEQAALAALAGAIGHSATALLAQGKAAADVDAATRAAPAPPAASATASLASISAAQLAAALAQATSSNAELAAQQLTLLTDLGKKQQQQQQQDQAGAALVALLNGTSTGAGSGGGVEAAAQEGAAAAGAAGGGAGVKQEAAEAAAGSKPEDGQGRADGVAAATE